MGGLCVSLSGKQLGGEAEKRVGRGGEGTVCCNVPVVLQDDVQFVLSQRICDPLALLCGQHDAAEPFVHGQVVVEHGRVCQEG